MSERYCTKCGQVLLPGWEGNLCLRCLDKKVNYSKLYYDTSDMAERLGRSEEQVRRMARSGKLPTRLRGARRNLWPVPEIEQWFAEGQPVKRLPHTPLQVEAYAMCRRQDHSWMGDERYEGDSYTCETQVDKADNTIIIGFVHTCFFCGHQEYHYL